MKSLFKDDLSSEAIVGNFLDKFFYSKGFSDFRRATSLDEQKDGVDVVVLNKEGELEVVDEKVQLTAFNKPTPSFAFELSYEAFGERKPGWFYKENATKYYLLGYFNSVKEDVKRLTNYNEIYEFEGLVVEKKVVQKFLESKGYNQENLLEKALELRNSKMSDNAKTGKREVLEDGINLFHTTFLSEQPLNVVIHRKHLDKLAKMIFRLNKISDDKYKMTIMRVNNSEYL